MKIKLGFGNLGLKKKNHRSYVAIKFLIEVIMSLSIIVCIGLTNYYMEKHVEEISKKAGTEGVYGLTREQFKSLCNAAIACFGLFVYHAGFAFLERFSIFEYNIWHHGLGLFIGTLIYFVILKTVFHLHKYRAPEV